jgi:hypothetical protein
LDFEVVLVSLGLVQQEIHQLVFEQLVPMDAELDAFGGV